MRILNSSFGSVLVEGDSGVTYPVSLRFNSCCCPWGTYRLSHPDKKECKHLAFAKHSFLVKE